MSSIQLGKKSNEKKVLAIALVTVFTGTGVAQAADVTAQAVATRVSNSQKDTTSKLVVTPLGNWRSSMPKALKVLTHKKVYLTWLSRVTQRLPPLN